jgi:hypothetical protein
MVDQAMEDAYAHWECAFYQCIRDPQNEAAHDVERGVGDWLELHGLTYED